MIVIEEVTRRRYAVVFVPKVENNKEKHTHSQHMYVLIICLISTLTEITESVKRKLQNILDAASAATLI